MSDPKACALKDWHAAHGMRHGDVFDVGRVTLFAEARARFPDAALDLEDRDEVVRALAAGRAVIGARLPGGRGLTRIDLLVPSPDGVRLIVLHGGKDPSGTFRAGRQLAAAEGLGVTWVGAAGFVPADFARAEAPADVRWGPDDRAGVGVWHMPRVHPRPYAPAPTDPPEATPSRRNCDRCGATATCAAIPSWQLSQLGGTTPDERERWRQLGLRTAEDALKVAPPASAAARRQLQAIAHGAPLVPPGWPRPIADVPADAVAIDLEGWDPPLTPWPTPEPFPRHIAAIAVADDDGARSWLAEPGAPPDDGAADALITLTPPGRRLLVWGHEDRRRIDALAARVSPARAAALRDIGKRTLDLGKRLAGIAWPHYAGHDLKSVARTATGADPWRGLADPFDPMRSVHRLWTDADDRERAPLLAYCEADARAVLDVMRVVRAL